MKHTKYTLIRKKIISLTIALRGRKFEGRGLDAGNLPQNYLYNKYNLIKYSKVDYFHTHTYETKNKLLLIRGVSGLFKAPLTPEVSKFVVIARPVKKKHLNY